MRHQRRGERDVAHPQHDQEHGQQRDARDRGPIVEVLDDVQGGWLFEGCYKVVDKEEAISKLKDEQFDAAQGAGTKSVSETPDKSESQLTKGGTKGFGSTTGEGPSGF